MPRRFSALSLTLSFVLTLGPAIALAGVLGLAPAEPPLWHPTESLAPAERFARIDALADHLHAAESREAQGVLELAILNAGSPRPADRHYAIELFEEAAELAPNRLDIVLWHMRLLNRTDRTLPAIDLLEASRDRFDGSAELAYALGYSYWLDGRDHLDPKSLQRSAQQMRLAHALTPDSILYARGVAALDLVRDKRKHALAALPPIEVGQSVAMPTLLLRAAALSFDPKDQERAEALFRQGIAALPDSLRQMFATGLGMIPSIQHDTDREIERFWAQNDPDPTRWSNAHRLEFWRRILQADMIFGGDGDQAGWNNKMGEAWVRWGRPLGLFHNIPDEIVKIVDTGREVGLRPQPSLRRSKSDNDPNLTRWHWYYDTGGSQFTLTFMDISNSNNWSLSSWSGGEFEFLQEAIPIVFPVPRVPRLFDLAIEVAGLMPTREQSVLIASFAVAASSEDKHEPIPFVDATPFEIEWALFDVTGREIDDGRSLLAAHHDRDRILSKLPEETVVATIRRARVDQISFALAPGIYRFAIEATDPRTGARRVNDSIITLGKRPENGHSISDIRLGASHCRFKPSLEVPANFVRHALVNVPQPDNVFLGEQEAVFVSYEVYDLGVDAGGTTRFDVGYTIERADEAAEQPEADRVLLTLDEESTHRFIEETTGRSSEAAVIKGTRLDLRDLKAGRYRLTVDIDDHVTGATASRSAWFSINPSQSEVARGGR